MELLFNNKIHWSELLLQRKRYQMSLSFFDALRSLQATSTGHKITPMMLLGVGSESYTPQVFTKSTPKGCLDLEGVEYTPDSSFALEDIP